MNKVLFKRARLSEVLNVQSTREFHTFFFSNSLGIYKDSLKSKNDFGSVLALGSSHIEAEELIKYPFKKIVLSGFAAPTEKTKEIIKKDKRVSYQTENIEKLSFKSQSFDLVFVKEALHHVPRPILGLYEMLRVSKKAVIFIEPGESLLGSILDWLKLSSKYETNQAGNQKFRDNFVYRWNKKEIVKMLNSYYLESGYKLFLSNCWMSNRYNMRFKPLIKVLNFVGWTLSLIPFNKGNYLTCVIFPGKDLPEEIKSF